MFMAPDRPYKTLLITSSGPTEGKTTVATWIAIAMAQAGQRVLLVDCDLRRPRLHRVFGKSGQIGVSTALMDGELPDAEAMSTEVPNLFILCAGPTPPNPAELLQSDKFKHLLARLTGMFDRVVIDSPPIVPVTDAAILSTQVDGTVFVVRAYSTTKDLARQGLRVLMDVGAHKAGVILNAVNLHRQEYGHYYYSYHRDNYYAPKDPPGGEEPRSTPSPPDPRR